MPKILTISARAVHERLPRRAPDCNKGNFGRVLVVAGSMAYRGAAVLCTEGALRGGAGLVYLATVEPVVALVMSRTPEACIVPCRTAPSGGIRPMDAAAAVRLAQPGSVLLAGPGLGESARVVLPVLLKAPWPAAVLDADALNYLAVTPRLHAQLPPAAILTPHPGEAARLLETTVAAVQADRPAAARALADKYHCIAVLKGAGTLIAAPGEDTLWQNGTGNPGLARGGSGDVLAGLIAGLLAQGLPPQDAALCGVWLHGAAADRAEGEHGQLSLLPHDLFTTLGMVLAELNR